MTEADWQRIWVSTVTPDATPSRDDSMNRNQVDLDLLVSRVVDHDATATEAHSHWAAFEAAAANHNQAWRELALAQRDALALAQVARTAESRASRVSLPSEADALRPMRLEEARRELERVERTSRPQRWSGYLGWAAAAVLALGFYSGRLNPNASRPANSGTQSAGLIPNLGASTEPSATEDHLARYLDQGHEEGRVVGELPDKVLIRATPTALKDGTVGYDVYYVRQILERVQVPDLYTFGATQDELGRATVQPVPVRINAPVRGPM